MNTEVYRRRERGLAPSKNAFEFEAQFLQLICSHPWAGWNLCPLIHDIKCLQKCDLTTKLVNICLSISAVDRTESLPGGELWRLHHKPEHRDVLGSFAVQVRGVGGGGGGVHIPISHTLQFCLNSSSIGICFIHDLNVPFKNYLLWFSHCLIRLSSGFII